MMSVTCPLCSRVGSLKTTVPVGTQVRCPGCRSKFEVQDEPSTIIEIDQPLVATTPKAYPSTDMIQQPPKDSRSAIPPEPWFYRWIDRFARVTWALALFSIVLVVVLMFVLGLIVVLNSGGLAPGVFVFGFYLLISPVVGSLPVFLASALLMLAVDAARNIRATRYR